MIDLFEFQTEIHKITRFLGYKINKRTTLKKLKEEYREFKTAKPVHPALIETAANIKNDKDFVYYFNTHLKGTEADEIPDSFFVLCSFCHENHYDIESLIMVKKRYNELRKKSK